MHINKILNYKMLQCWESEREFHIGGFTLLCQFIEPVMSARCAIQIFVH